MELPESKPALSREIVVPELFGMGPITEAPCKRYLLAPNSDQEYITEVKHTEEEIVIEEPMDEVLTALSIDANDSAMQMLDKHALMPMDKTDYEDLTGIYLYLLGRHNGGFVVKFGESYKNLESRINASYTRYHKVRDATFQMVGSFVYFKEVTNSKRVESKFKLALKSVGVYMGNSYKIANEPRCNTEVFALTESFTISHAIDLLEEVSEGYDTAKIQAIVDKQSELDSKHELKLLKEKNKLLELQIKLRSVELDHPSIKPQKRKTKVLKGCRKVMK